MTHDHALEYVMSLNKTLCTVAFIAILFRAAIGKKDYVGLYYTDK